MPGYKISGDLIRSINFHVVTGCSPTPGQFRTEPIHIERSNHVPPDSDKIPDLFGDLCINICDMWDDYDPFDIAAYALWRLTWIHPFTDGNGRTADSVAYYILCRKFEFWFPGQNTIPAYWRDHKDERYYKALAEADMHNTDTPEATTKLSNLLRRALMNQLKSADLE